MTLPYLEHNNVSRRNDVIDDVSNNRKSQIIDP